MKTQIIQLDLHDDVTSIRDKMSWAKTERILLICPRRLRVLSRPLHLRLILRHAAGLGAQLAIVARSNELRRTAQEVGVPTFRTAAAAQRQDWEVKNAPVPPQRRLPRPDLHQMRDEAFPPEPRWRSLFVLRLLFFLFALLAILAILALFIPSATIQLTPATRLQSLTFPISASPQVTTVNLAGDIPARSVLAVAERKGTQKVSGTAAIPDAKASGSVRFRNQTIGIVNIPAGTVVSTLTSPPVRFVTTGKAILDAGVDKTVDIPVQAVEGGTSGNLPPDSLLAIEGNLGASSAVTNTEPTTGGSDRTAPVQTASDRLRLRTSLVADLLEECRTTMAQMIAPGDVLFDDTLAVAQVFDESYFPAEGQPGETLTLTLNIQCQVQYASAADLQTLGTMTLDATLPDGFIPVTGGQAEITSATSPIVGTDGVVRWQVQAQRLLQARLDSLSVMELILGHRPAVATRRLQADLSLAKTPVIRLTPSWWPWLPLLPFRISLATDH